MLWRTKLNYFWKNSPYLTSKIWWTSTDLKNNPILVNFKKKNKKLGWDLILYNCTPFLAKLIDHASYIERHGYIWKRKYTCTLIFLFIVFRVCIRPKKELSCCHTRIFLFRYCCNPTMNAIRSNNVSLKYQRFSSYGCKDIGFTKTEFVAKKNAEWDYNLINTYIVIEYRIIIFCICTPLNYPPLPLPES